MWYWPNLVLTEYEKQFCGVYKSGKKPGVLRRAYELQLSSTAQAAQGIPAATTIGKVQIARRSRVFAITFSGNLDGWRLSIKNTNGTLYTNPTPRTNLAPVVTSLICGSLYNAAALGFDASASTVQGPHSAQAATAKLTQSYGTALGVTEVGAPTTTQAVMNVQNMPWLIEPNWVCQPNESLIFEGLDISPTYVLPAGNAKLPQILNITYHAWEFPGMGNAPASKHC